MRQPYGQNFLVDKNIARNIVEAAAIAHDDTVVEIGPGKGVLTGLLVSRAKSVTAVELDRNLARELAVRYAAAPSVTIINRDFLSWELPAHPYTVVANLPYYLSTAILEKILPERHWASAVVMVQKEVGERIAAKPGTKEYGAFSLFCQYYASAALLFKVGPGSFFPRPKIDSAVLRFENLLPPPPDKTIFSVIRIAFQQRRKTILNTLSNGLGIQKEAVSDALKAAAIDPMRRPENLTFEDFRNLTFYLKKYIIL